MIKRVSIIGSGNVATQLGLGFLANNISVSHVVSRSTAHAQELAEKLNTQVCSLTELPVDQLCVICVSDDAVRSVLNDLPLGIPAVYTSGSVGIDQLPQRAKIGVFYPLQTLSKTKQANLTEVPFLVESNNTQFLDQIYDLAIQLSPNTHIVNSEQRRKIHMAAVWINNFTNHVVQQAQAITQEQNLDYKLLLPLLKETFNKLEEQSAHEAQTGPARRGDINTIESHLNAMQGTRKELYALLSKSIQETYKND